MVKSLRGAGKPPAAANTLLLTIQIVVVRDLPFKPCLVHFVHRDLLSTPFLIRRVDILISKVDEGYVTLSPHAAVLDSSRCASSCP